MPIHPQYPDGKKDQNGTEQSLPVDVLLIYPYFNTHAPKAMLFHPLGIAQLVAILRGCGLATQVIDCTFDHHEEWQRGFSSVIRGICLPENPPDSGYLY